MIQYLTKRLQEVSLLKVTDIIIVSDHGMDTFYYHPEYMEGNIIDLHRVIGRDSCDIYGSSPVLQVVARPGQDQMELCGQLKDAAAVIGHFNVYTNDELKTKKPYWHINNPQRFGPCTVVAEPGFVFQDVRERLRKEHLDYKNCNGLNCNALVAEILNFFVLFQWFRVEYLERMDMIILHHVCKPFSWPTDHDFNMALKFHSYEMWIYIIYLLDCWALRCMRQNFKLMESIDRIYGRRCWLKM